MARLKITNGDTRLVLQRRFLIMVCPWPEIAPLKASPQSCYIRRRTALKSYSTAVSCESSL